MGQMELSAGTIESIMHTRRAPEPGEVSGVPGITVEHPDVDGVVDFEREMRDMRLEVTALDYLVAYRPQCVGRDAEGKPIPCEAALARATFLLSDGEPMESLAQRDERTDGKCANELGIMACGEMITSDTSGILYTEPDVTEAAPVPVEIRERVLVG